MLPDKARVGMALKDRWLDEGCVLAVSEGVIMEACFRALNSRRM
jgi:hypothetical protein